MEKLYTLYHSDIPPILSELAAAPPIQRLTQVGMNCGCEYTAFPRFRRGKQYNRYLHSLGVGLIVWHFTGDPAQAASGILHDVATPTFAHVVDFLRGDHLTQESTESGTLDRISGSPALQRILEKYGLTTQQVSDYHIYPIADNDSPRLSADRLEYTLGNALSYGILTRQEIGALYEDLTVGNNEDNLPELCFRHRDAALLFARTALQCSKIYVSPEDRYSMQALADLLRQAIEIGVLTPTDLDGTEPALIAKLSASSLSAAWTRYRSISRILEASVPPDDRPWRCVPAKRRHINPMVSGQGRASDWNPAFARELETFLAEDQSRWLLGIAEA